MSSKPAGGGLRDDRARIGGIFSVCLCVRIIGERLDHTRKGRNISRPVGESKRL